MSAGARREMCMVARSGWAPLVPMIIWWRLPRAFIQAPMVFSLMLRGKVGIQLA